ncbi:MAG TPA: PAS domain S-box protein, partial [Burkholderiaceae bacterium]|nr:PAS domain S-box protein [Burkholderiaceae bacterium]
MSAASAPDRWPFAPGEAAACIRGLDGDNTPLGPPSQWSAALRTTIDLMLPSQAEIVLFWGPQFVAFYNDTYAPTIGAKHPSAMGRPAQEHWTELWDDLHPLLERVLTLGETVSAKDRPFQINRHGHMEEVFFDISYSPVREPDGSVGGVLCIVSETTSRVKATRQLAASEEHLRELHEQWRLAQAAGGVGVFVLDIQRDTLTASPGFCRVFGLPEQEVHAPEAVQRLRTDSADGDPVSTRESRTRGTAPLDVEYPIRRADDGALRWIWRRAEIVRDAHGQPLLMRGVVQDVTERHEARLALAQLNASLEERVQERTRELNRIWSLSADLMISVGFDGRIVSVNPAWTQVLGWPDDGLVGTDVLALLHPEDVEPSRHALGQLAQGQRLLRYENRFRHQDGSYRTFSWTAVPDTSGQIHAVGRDVTALRESEQRLRHSQKMEAIGQLTGGIAHDFNNMLQGITGAIEVMRRRVAAGRTSDLDRFMDSATQSAQRAASLVQRLLAFSRRQSLDLKPVDVNVLIASMEELMHRSLGEQVRLSVQLAPDARHALGDESQLESAILNLAINARDAMPGGGTLWILAGNRTVGTDTGHGLTASALAAGDYVVLQVRDTGTGMPDAVAARAFEPFFTTKEVGRGTGLGLSMVHGLATQSG